MRQRTKKLESMLHTLFEAADFAGVCDLLQEYPYLESNLIVQESQAAIQLERLVSSTRVVGRKIFNEAPVVVTVLHTTPPHVLGGYGGRSHGLIKALIRQGIHVIPVSRPGFWATTSQGRQSDVNLDFYDGVLYRHLKSDVDRKDGEIQYMLESVREYREFFRSAQPDLIHLRSTYLIALPALIAGHSLGVPCVYEVSGLWELVHEGRGHTGEANRARALEAITMNHADGLCTLTQSMAEIIQSRLNKEIEVVLTPNAVELDDFVQSSEISDRSIPTVGYVGSLLDYEGLDTLIQAMAKLNSEGTQAKLRIVGGGPEIDSLKALSSSVGGDDYTTFTGNLSPSEARAQYQHIDIAAFPRHSTPATEAVSPLKPFEAMASKKPIVVSDVSALQEIADSGRGLIARAGDSSSLATQLQTLIQDKEKRDEISERAFEFVTRRHTWDVVASTMANLFKENILG